MAKQRSVLDRVRQWPAWAKGLAALIAVGAVAAIVLLARSRPQPPSQVFIPAAGGSVEETPSAASPLPTPSATAAAAAQAVSPPPTPTPSSASGEIPVYTYKIVNVYPHDRDAFTQGLVYVDGVLYEGTGLYGRSSLRIVDLETGEPVKLQKLPIDFFGEGITVMGDKLYQLTWKSRLGFVYDRETFDLLKQFTYRSEGWGITHDGERLIVSDGSALLYFWDPETLEELGRVTVRDDKGPVMRLNELEYVNGEVFANVWQTNRIARIDPKTGRVVGWIKLGGLLTKEDMSRPVDVLNGIAYDAEGDRLFVTGKLWPKLFEIELVRK